MAERTSSQRLPAIDLLRGAVMILMALDHTRDFFSCFSTGEVTAFESTDLPKPYPTRVAGPVYFLTRWVTHYCAPTFVLLAGLGAGLSLQRGMSKGQLARFLFIRGFWLMLLECTLVHAGFFFSFDLHDMQGAVIWVLGASMVLLAGLQYLPRYVLIGFAAVLIFEHNMWDGFRPVGPLGWVWVLLHNHATIPLGSGYELSVPYKIVPWVGVMTLGYLLADVYRLDVARRRRFFFTLGALACLLFVVIRGINGYGDPQRWTSKHPLSFLNCEKYPPSLDYLLMTLGPAFLALAAFDRSPGWLGRRVIVFGRVPLFFYILHLYLIHGGAILVSSIRNGGPYCWWLTTSPGEQDRFLKENYWPGDLGYTLPYVYLAWLVVLAILYPLCVRFGELKRKYPSGILSYF